MANELKMATIQSILSLHAQGWPQQRIADALGVDRGTVSRYVRQAAQAASPDSGPDGSKPANLPTGSTSKTRNLPTGSEGADTELPDGKTGTKRKKPVPEPSEACQS